MNLRRPSHRSLAVGVLTSISLGLTSDAVVVPWDGTIGLWNDPVNWVGDVVPAAGDEGRINNGGTAIIDSTQAINALFVILGDVTGTSGNLQMTGGSLTTTSDIRIGNGGTSGGTGLITHSGGDVIMNGGNMNVGFGDTAVGRYDVSGGTFLIGSANIFAVGNRGSGVVNQTGGSIYVRGSTANAAASQVNLGRNGAVAPPNPGTASGTYTLSGGDLTAATLRFGNNANGAATGSTNIFNLQGTGLARFGAISIINPNASNTFNFTGGSLTANTISIPLTNNGGVLRPATLSFAGQALADVQASAVGTTTFDVSSYTQTALGTLAIDIASPTSNDFLNIGFGLGVGDAALAGTIAVNLLNGFDPPLGSTFDIVSADTITETAAINGLTPSGLGFDAFEVNSPDGREILRLVVVPEPSTFAFLAGAAGLAALRRRRLA